MKTKYVSEHFSQDKKEALEIVGVNDIIIRRCVFTKGTTLLRFNNCNNVIIQSSMFTGALGPPDPDGQCIQFIRSTGMILGCDFHSTDQSEDLISIYADVPTPGTVLIQNCTFTGRGTSNSCTSICCDGPYCPPTTIDRCKIVGARCGITLAGGINHHITKTIEFDNCETQVFTHDYYGKQFGHFVIESGKVVS